MSVIVTQTTSIACLDALALCYCTPDVEEADYGDGSGKTSVGEVVAMPFRLVVVPGLFEPEAICAMSEAFEAAQGSASCQSRSHLKARSFLGFACGAL
jgi:hypothetical protein